jgi:arylsulfatase A-like enzyme
MERALSFPTAILVSLMSSLGVCRAGAVRDSSPNMIIIFIDDLHLMHNDLDRDSKNHGVLFPGDRKGLNPDEVTIAEMLKERGYATACIGKWHLGDHPEFLPTRQGFDEFFGVPTSAGMPFPLPLFRDEKLIREMAKEDLDLMTMRFTEEAMDFIESQAGAPFFLYFPHTMVHGPHHVSPEFQGKTGKRLYADGVAEIDWSVGQILNKLRELGIDKETLVLFLSDNGGPLFEPMKVLSDRKQIPERGEPSIFGCRGRSLVRP